MLAVYKENLLHKKYVISGEKLGRKKKKILFRDNQSQYEGLFNLIFILYWGIVDLQCCVSLMCTAEWFSFMHMYI